MARSSPSVRCANCFNPSIPGCGPIFTASAPRCCNPKRVREMETRAPFVVVGAFVLAAITAVFGFVYWLHNTGGPRHGAASPYPVRAARPGRFFLAALLLPGVQARRVQYLLLFTPT